MIILILAITQHTGLRLAEVGFLLILIAGLWLVAAQIPQLKMGTLRWERSCRYRWPRSNLAATRGDARCEAAERELYRTQRRTPASARLENLAGCAAPYRGRLVA